MEIAFHVKIVSPPTSLLAITRAFPTPRLFCNSEILPFESHGLEEIHLLCQCERGRQDHLMLPGDEKEPQPCEDDVHR